MKTTATCAGTYRSPVETEPDLQAPTKAHLLPTRQLWIARDADEGLFLFPFQPVWNGEQFEPADVGHYVAHLPEEWFPELRPGFCQVFAKQGPQVDKRIKRDGAEEPV